MKFSQHIWRRGNYNEEANVARALRAARLACGHLEVPQQARGHKPSPARFNRGYSNTFAIFKAQRRCSGRVSAARRAAAAQEVATP